MHRRLMTCALPTLLLLCTVAAPTAEPDKAAAGGKPKLTPEEQRARAQCSNNLSNLIKCCHLWADAPAHEARFPPAIEDLFPDYARIDRVFLCPAVQEHKLGVRNVEHCDYVYIPGSTPMDATHVVLFCPKANHGGKLRVLAIGAGAVSTEDSEADFRKALLETLKDLKISLDLPKASDPKALSAEEVAKLKAALGELGSEDFATRERATQALAAAGEAARPLLEEGTRANDVETQSRCRQILNAQEKAKAKGAWLVAVRKELGLDAPAPAGPEPPKKKE
jgi:hypothetical protein